MDPSQLMYNYLIETREAILNRWNGLKMEKDSINHVTSWFRQNIAIHASKPEVKKAFKWIAIGAVCLGVQRLLSKTPVYINDTHQKAIDILSQDSGSNSIHVDSKNLLDHYFNEQRYRYWPESGKSYIAACLNTDSLPATVNTRYFIEKAWASQDDFLIREASKICASAKSSTQSCLAMQEVLTSDDRGDDVDRMSKTMVRACKKSENVFCQRARELSIKQDIETKEWSKISRGCLNVSNATPACLRALESLGVAMDQSDRKASLEIAKEVTPNCRKADHAVCKTAKAVIIKNTASFGSRKEIIMLTKTQCKNLEDPSCVDFIEDASTAFLAKVQNEPPPNDYDVYSDLYYSRMDQAPTSITEALVLTEACLRAPASAMRRSNVKKMIQFLEHYKENLKPQRAWGWPAHEILDKLEPKIIQFKKQLTA